MLLERYAVSGGTSVPDNPVGQSHANLGVAGPIRQGSLTALSKASLAPSTDSKGPGARPTAGDVKRLGSSRGRLDIKVTSPLLETMVGCFWVPAQTCNWLTARTGCTNGCHVSECCLLCFRRMLTSYKDYMYRSATAAELRSPTLRSLGLLQRDALPVLPTVLHAPCGQSLHVHNHEVNINAVL